MPVVHVRCRCGHSREEHPEGSCTNVREGFDPYRREVVQVMCICTRYWEVEDA